MMLTRSRSTYSSSRRLAFPWKSAHACIECLNYLLAVFPCQDSIYIREHARIKRDYILS